MTGFSWRRARHAGLLVLVWLVVSLGSAAWMFFHSSRTIDLASHETVIRPTLSGYAEMHTGPLLPDLRVPSSSSVGVDVDLGGTRAVSLSQLVQRYAFIASHPEGQIARVESTLVQMAVAAGVRGAVIGLLPVGAWVVAGPRVRSELHAVVRRPRVLAATAAAVVLTTAVLWPWSLLNGRAPSGVHWRGLQDYVGVPLDLPAELSGVQISTNLTTRESKRLVLSAVRTYQASLRFYDRAAELADALPLRKKREGETVVLLVSDRHDNIGMDQVASAVADAAGATVVFDAGDDTSTGSSWEAFSLDSLQERFGDFERFAVAGNHDHGSFVSDYLVDRGWTNPDGSVVDGPDGSLLWGVDDPRSSGLGDWVDLATGSYTEFQASVADDVCGAPRRVSTVLVHAASMGQEVLTRGCADLVLGGHLHVQQGPTRVVGSNGRVGYSFTNGTTGGAAYAIAVGSKPRREAEVTLITYRDGRPVGLQPVRLQTNGLFSVDRYTELTY
ncbi:MAG: metallophosphoesterase [Nocardioidaceae bacterium]